MLPLPSDGGGDDVPAHGIEPEEEEADDDDGHCCGCGLDLADEMEEEWE